MSLHRTTKSGGPDARVAAPVKVEREDLPVMFTRAVEDTPAAIQHAWAEFEATVGLRGRKFFGAVYDEAREYWVCTQLKTEDDPEALRLEVGTLPGGTYLRTGLQGEPPGIYEKIASTFDELTRQAEIDTSRPSIEFYRQSPPSQSRPRGATEYPL